MTLVYEVWVAGARYGSTLNPDEVQGLSRAARDAHPVACPSLLIRVATAAEVSA